jgi:hypothetical protein
MDSGLLAALTSSSPAPEQLLHQRAGFTEIHLSG